MEFLQKIEVKGILRRRSRSKKYEMYPRMRIYKEWVYEPLRTPIEGIVIGKRTLANGNTYYEEDCGNIFTPEVYTKALLVVTDMKTKPFYVPLPTPELLQS